MKKIFTLCIIACSHASFGQVKISQVYGGGGNPGAAYTQDFIEIFNASLSTVDISNWSIQYASATGPVSPGDWAVTAIPPGNSLIPGSYFLVALASCGTNGVALPVPDISNNAINISNTAGKIALTNNSTPLNGTTACGIDAVVDVIGYGSAATCSETSFASTNGIDNTKSLLRFSGGCTDYNNNAADFIIYTANPRNHSISTNACLTQTPVLTASPNVITRAVTGTNSEYATVFWFGFYLTGFPGSITAWGTNFITGYDNTAGSWNTIIPNNNPEGVKAIITFPFGSFLPDYNADPDGIWPGNITTVNPTGGATMPLQLSVSAAPLNTHDCSLYVPVKLSSFTVQKMKDAVKISWTTEQEINSNHFIIQRSPDEKIWKDIIAVNGAGISNTKINYTATDSNPLAGINYYRLKQVDTDTHFEYSEIRAVLFSTGFEISVNPNPSRNNINVYISKNDNLTAAIVLTDINGKELKKIFTAESIVRVNTAMLSPGIYFVKVVSNGEAETKKIILY